MLLFPNAKINIGLNIVCKRSDGYHDLETVFYPIQVKDAIEVIEAETFTFTHSGIFIHGREEDNLCVKAYQLLLADYNLPPVHVHLHKHIPIGAGLGGGSADAAFFIKLLNEKFALNLSITQREAYCRKLGADCAFFIRNKPVFACGKGDDFADVELDLSVYYLVLVMPPVQVPTAEAYRGVKPKLALYNLREIIQLPVSEWKQYIKNDFEEVIFLHHPIIRGVKEALYEAGAVYVAMSGSGAAVYGIFHKPVGLSHLEKYSLVFYGV